MSFANGLNGNSSSTDRRRRIVGRDIQRVDPSAKIDSGRLRVEAVRVTPALAAAWLEKEDKNNRKPSDSRVAMYARDMRAGKWGLNAETVKFDKDGVLFDGGHRLRAIIEGDVELDMAVAWNASRTGVDRGRSRSTMDSRRMSGQPASRAYISSIKTIQQIEQDNWNSPISDAEVDDLERKHAFAAAWLKDHAKGKALFPAAVLGALAYAYERDPVATDEFAMQIATKVNLQPRSPAIAFLRQFENGRGKASAHGCGSQGRRFIALLTLQAVRNHIQGINGTFLKASEETLTWWMKRKAER